MPVVSFTIDPDIFTEEALVNSKHGIQFFQERYDENGLIILDSKNLLKQKI